METEKDIIRYANTILYEVERQLGLDLLGLDIDIYESLEGAGRAYIDCVFPRVGFNILAAKEMGELYKPIMINIIADIVMQFLYPDAEPHGSEWSEISKKIGGTGIYLPVKKLNMKERNNNG